MLSTILSTLFHSTQSTLTTTGLSGLLLVWLMGHLTDFPLYKSARAGFGKACESAGKLLSKFGDMRLGQKTWGYIENILMDWLIFGVEQFGVGLRSDNVEKLQDHLERLQSVGSVTRAEAIADKIDLLKNPSPIPMQDVQDAAVQARMLDGLKSSSEEKLSG